MEEAIKTPQHVKNLKFTQYAIIFVASFGLLSSQVCNIPYICCYRVLQIVRCVFKYEDKSTGTRDYYVPISDAPFPDLTFCPSYPYKIERLNYHGILTK